MTYGLVRPIRPSLQLNKTTALLLCLPLFVAMVSCSKSSEQATPAETAVHSAKNSEQADAIFYYVEVKEKITSDTSPLGYWEKVLRYPLLVKDFRAPVKTLINDSVMQLTNKYKCDTDGDQTFEAEVTMVNAALIGFKYNAMWLCDTMPRPDSTVGAVTYDLETGAELKLVDEVIDKTAADNLRKMIVSKFNQLINDKNQSGANCPPPAPSDIFYLHDQSMVFRAEYPDHADSACEVEVAVSLTELKGFFKSSSKLMQAF